MNASDPSRTLQLAQRAYELQPTRRETIQNLAEALAINGRLDEAIRYYRIVEQGLRPQSPERAVVSQRIRELERGLP